MDKIRERIGYLPEFAPKPQERALSFLVRLARVNSPYDRQSLKSQAKEALEDDEGEEHSAGRSIRAYSLLLF